MPTIADVRGQAKGWAEHRGTGDAEGAAAEFAEDVSSVLDRLEARLQASRQLLRRIQWGQGVVAWCPDCEATETEGHFVTCRLAALLGPVR